jgi:hypothetical protein
LAPAPRLSGNSKPNTSHPYREICPGRSAPTRARSGRRCRRCRPPDTSTRRSTATLLIPQNGGGWSVAIYIDSDNDGYPVWTPPGAWIFDGIVDAVDAIERLYAGDEIDNFMKPGFT